MAWEKTHNIWSEDTADSLAPKNLQKTNMLGSIWGKNLPAPTKEDSSVQRMIVDRVRETFRRFGPSGWSTRGAFSFSAGYPANAFRAALSKAIVDGLTLIEVGSGLNSEATSEFPLPAPPGSGTRNDLVWLEMFLVEVPGSTASLPTSVNKPSNTTIYKYGNRLFGGTNPADDINEVNYEIRRRVQVQYRIRTVGGVDFTTYPNGLGDPGVFAQGPQAAPTALLFAAASGDAGLWIAGNGSAAHQSILGTVDGYVYAIPIAKVARTAGVTEIQSGNVTDLRKVWGATYPYISIGATPAQSGAVRLTNNEAITSRNAANTADIELVKLDASDIIQLASGGQAVSVGGNLQRGAITGHFLLQAVQGDVTQPTYSFVGDTNTGMLRITDDTLGFATAGIERVRITSGGNVGIGELNPAVALHVAGDFQVGNSQATSPGAEALNKSIILWGTINNLDAAIKLKFMGPGLQAHAIVEAINEGAGGNIGLAFLTAVSNGLPTEKMRIRANGNVGIGVNNPSYQLQLSTDSAAKPSSSTWTVTSDERLKTETTLADLARCYDIVRALPLKHYRWKDEAYGEAAVRDRGKLGWIAQDVRNVLPKSVSQQAFHGAGISLDDCLSLNADQIYAVLYGAVQFLQQRVEALEADRALRVTN